MYVLALSFLQVFICDQCRDKPEIWGVTWLHRSAIRTEPYDFFLHNIKALRGKPLSHPMELPGNGANSNATTIPMTAWPKYHRGSTLWANFCHDKPRKKFSEDDQDCWGGEKASKKHRRDLKDTATTFYPFHPFSCLMKLSQKVKLPSKSKPRYC